MTQTRLKHFGWGRENEGLTPAEEAFVLGRLEQLFGMPADREVKPPRLEDIKLGTAPAYSTCIVAVLLDRALRPRGTYLRQILPRLRARTYRRLRQRTGRGCLSAY